MNAHTPFDANQDWSNPYCRNSSNDPMVDSLLGNAYHVVRAVYCNLGNLKLLYDFLNQYGMVIGVQSEAELKALTADAKYARIYGFSRAGDRQVTDYLYVEGDRTGIIPDDPEATGSWITVATSGSNGGGTSSGGGAYIPWVYANGSATGGETTINVPDNTVGVPFIIINGDMQYVGRGFEFNIDDMSVTLAQPLEEGDEVVFLLTGTPAVPDNPNVNDWVQINWLYNGGYAVGGEQVIVIPYTFESVPAIYKNGERYYAGLADKSYTVDAANQRIFLTEPLVTNDRLIVTIGGESTTLIISDRTIQEVARSVNVHENEVILSTNTTQYLNGMKVIYDVVEQKIYGLPTLPTNVYIQSVSNGKLTYAPGSVTVDLTPILVSTNVGFLAIEALRRTYAEAGYNLVEGSFGRGGTVNTATDVLLNEVDGKAYSWGGTLPKVVAAGSTLASTGGTAWIDRSKLVTVKSFGAKGDGTTDDTTAIQTAAQYAIDNDMTLVFEEGVYMYTSIQVMSSTPRQATTKWIANGDVRLVSTKSTPDTTDYDADYAIRFRGVFVDQVSLAADAVRNAGVITLSDVSNIEVGDLVGLQSSRLIQTDHRGQAREGQLCKVTSVNSTTKRVGLQNTLRYMAPAARNQSGTVTSAVSGAEFTTSGLTLTRRNSNVRIRFNSGANSGQTRYVTRTSGNTLYIGGDQSGFPNTPAVGDTFTLEWVTDVSIIKPIKVQMLGNFTISREVTTGAVAGAVGFRGLDVLFSDNAVIDGVTVEGFSETGIRLRGSFQPTLLNATVRDANRGYNTFDGTGYGISINQCFGAFVDNAKTYRCRKGLDIIGTQMISWETMVKGCTVSGGGVDYQGNAFWPNGPTENSGMGSHGAGYSSEYHDCLVVDCHLPYAVRGLRESFINCRVHGYVANACLRVAYGGALTVDGLTYDDTFTEIGQTVSASYSEDSRPGSRATGMVELFCGENNGYLRTYPITIKNCNAKKVTLSFLLATGAGDTLTLENVSMGNNTVYVSSEETSTTEFSFVRTEGPKVIKNVQDLGGNRFILDGGIENQWCMYDLRVLTIPEGGYVRLGDNKFFCTLADDQALRLPISTKSKTAIVTLFDHEAQRNYRAHSMQLEVGVATDRSPLQATNKVGVNVTNTPLTGTTGTDGTFTVAFSPTGGYGYLYLENRMGALMRPCVIIETVPF